MKSGPIVSRRERKDVGSCNACTRGGYRYVWVITLRSLHVRVCRYCRDMLVTQLTKERPYDPRA